MVETNFQLIPKSFYETEGGEQKLVVSKQLADAVQTGVQARLNELPPAERQTFIDMVQNLAPGDLDTQQKLDGVLDAFEAAAKLLSTTDSVPAAYIGDIADFLARAMIKSQGRERENALEQRFEAHQAAKADLEDQASQSRSAADKMTSGAIASLVTGVVGGGAGVLGGLVSAGGSLRATSDMSGSMKILNGLEARMNAEQQKIDFGKTVMGTPGADPNAVSFAAGQTRQSQTVLAGLRDSQVAAKSAFERAQARSGLAGSVGQVAGTGGDIARSAGSSADSQMQAQAKKADAQGSEDAARAEFENQVAERQKAMEDALNDMIKQTIAFIKDLQDAKIDVMRSMTRV